MPTNLNGPMPYDSDSLDRIFAVLLSSHPRQVTEAVMAAFLALPVEERRRILNQVYADLIQEETA